MCVFKVRFLWGNRTFFCLAHIHVVIPTKAACGCVEESLDKIACRKSDRLVCIKNPLEQLSIIR